MHILLVEPYYHPDGGPAAPLFTMLSQELVRRGHKVTALTAVPHYPSGRIPEFYRGVKIRRTVEKDVHVIRVPLPSVDRSKLAQRMWQFFAYQVGAILAGWKINCDVFITITPSLEIWLPFLYFSIFRGKPSVYSVHDVYPNSGIQLGIFRHKAIIKLVTLLEKSCAKRANSVRILSKSFESGVKSLGVPENRIHLIYDWVDTDLITPIPKSNSFAIEQGLDRKFVVLYAGNIGFSQGLENVVEAAYLLADNDVQFVFVGDGAEKETLIAKSQSYHLQNVTFLPFQPRSRLSEVLCTADVSLVILRESMGFNSLPSKTLSILASGRPMIVSIDLGSDTCKLIEKAKAGICIHPEDPRLLAKKILFLKYNPALCEEMGKNGRNYALQNHSPNAAAEAFENLFREIVNPKS